MLKGINFKKLYFSSNYSIMSMFFKLAYSNSTTGIGT